MRTSGFISREELTGCSKKIYFDGFLPSSKFDIRLERLVVQTRRLTAYHQVHSTPCWHRSIWRLNGIKPEYGKPGVQANALNLPPPFLVPAVLEALGESESFQGITSVVPDEADAYCARYVKKNGGIIFTGDSDLLLHDLGSNGAVVFFKDVETYSDGGPGNICGRIFHPTELAARLELSETYGLRAIAFEIVMDNHATFPKLLKQASALQAITAYSDHYASFERDYISSLADSTVTSDMDSKQSLERRSVLRTLDPRISEYVLQFSNLIERCGQRAAKKAPASESPHIFLPFLLDCPVRTNAWEISTPLRQLAYGLINLVVPTSQHCSAVFEHRRQQEKSKGRELQLPTFEEITDACTSLLNILDRLHKQLPGLSNTEYWIALAIYQDIDWSSLHSKTPFYHPVSEQLRNIENSMAAQKSYSWDIAHFIAQIQGSHYSLRIAKQILGVLVSFYDSHESLPESCFLLHRHLETLSPIKYFPGIQNTSEIIRLIESRGFLNVIHELAGVAQSDESTLTQTPPKAPKQRRKRRQTSADPSKLQHHTTNPFELLDVE